MAVSPELTSAMEKQFPQGATIEPNEAQELTVCITKKADGTYMVGPESEEPMAAPDGTAMEGMEGMPPAGPEEAEESTGMQPAASIDEALDMARQLLETGGSGEMTVEQAFQGGFNGEPMGKAGY